ncbi:ribonucleoside-diphosphate reductase [Haladaptatus sp. GCM10025707]|uniref:ribonucleoside-diphosphate reductase n=1 Tax=unclassified Haladaptatus TaxID=2622732 RepID=UPI0023E89FB8|nr:ribonucleoside-diphosphate reductase [Haladaptatus sp. QDMS2]
MHLDSTRGDFLDRETRSFRYFKNAVSRHWDPGAIDLSADRAAVESMNDLVFDRFRGAIAKFGAGEQAVTTDLAPLAVVLEAPEDQAFITTQLYEEAKHTDFFDRYWQEVVNEAEAARGEASTSPQDDRWYVPAYVELFDRTEAAMEALLTDDSPANRARAYCHYHLVVEGILAQTAYFGLQQAYGPDTHPELPTLPGLTAGLTKIRGDEGRHVGFGMAKLKALVEDGVDPTLLHETVSELLPLVNATTTDDLEATDGMPGPAAADLTTYAASKHTERMEQIVDAARDIPDVEALTALD